MRIVLLLASALICQMAAAGSPNPKATQAPPSIEDLSGKLDAVLETGVETKLDKGSSARELIEQKYMKDRSLTQLDDEFQYVSYASDIVETDGDGIGTSTPGAALSFLLDMADRYLSFDKNGDPLTKERFLKRKAKVTDLVELLRKSGAEFGFDANGSAVCGVNYTTLYLIEVPQKTVHEYIFATGPC